MRLAALLQRPGLHMLAGIVASAVLSAVYAQGGLGWCLGFVVWVPWLITLENSRTLRGTLCNACAMAVAYTAGVFAWFGVAVGNYTQVGAAPGLAVLLLAAPVFQPQLLAFALVRYAARRRHGRAVTALAAAAAWVGAEWLLPKMLGDTLGHGLYPAPLLRQGAELGGAALLTLLLLLVNEALHAALAQRRNGLRAVAAPLAFAAAVPLLMAGYGLMALDRAPNPDAKPLRIGMVQANITDYERLRQTQGALAVVRDVLDTHFAMSYDAVVGHKADAVLWSETVYPTPFKNPKSALGAELDQEIVDTVRAAGVPFVFGTYDRDGAGEYNAAAFVEPAAGLLGFYRKTNLFPLTEFIPAWLDHPVVRGWLPWTGNWRAGNGARVIPLRLAGGREIPVQALICLDDVDSQLAIDAARLGAQALLTLSNDSWFTATPQGARLHLAVAAFRSIETGLPQFRVTTNGASAAIDRHGAVVASAAVGQRVLVIGDLPVGPTAPTLQVAWGNWVGALGCGFLLVLASWAMVGRRFAKASAHLGFAKPLAWPVSVVLLPPAMRLVTALLRGFARGNLLWMGAAMLLNDSLRGNTLAQIRLFVGWFVVPEALAVCLLLAFAARATLDQGMLVLTRSGRAMALAIGDIAAVSVWRLPLPGPGLTLHLANGTRWRYGLATLRPDAWAQALQAAGATPTDAKPTHWAAAYGRARQAIPKGWLDHAGIKFGLLPLALALPAFRLHQHIAYGGTFGEFYTFGLKAYLTTLSIWWAAWAIGVVLCAAALRAAIEAGTAIAVLAVPQQALTVRQWLERAGLALLYAGLPAWLSWKAFGN